MKPSNRGVHRRPLTRAFARHNGSRVKDLTLDDLDAASGKYRTRKSAAAVSSRHPQRATRLRNERRKKIPTTSQSENAENERPAPLPIPDSQDGSHFNKISTWLDNLDTPTISQVVSPRPKTSYEVGSSDANDTASSSLSNTSAGVVDDDATTEASEASHISFIEHLEFRGIAADPSNDGNLQHFNLATITQEAPREINFQNFDNLLETLKSATENLERLIQDQPLENGFPFYDKLMRDITGWRPQNEEFRRFPAPPLYYFDQDRRDCFNSSEVTLHRIIAMSIVDRHDFRGLFSYSCEEQWKISSHLLLQPTRRTSKIPQPKPGIAISFHRDALKDWDLPDYPIELGECLHPGGKDRWFPFFFMEANGDDCSLRDAFEKNLHSASQALLNIYHWMRVVPEMTKRFFTEVRVFSVTLVNEKLTMKMHRAEKDSTGRLRFKYVVVKKINDHDQSDTARVIESVLIDYAEPRLYPILKDVVEAATQPVVLRQD